MPVYRDGQELARATADRATLISRTRRVPERSLRAFFDADAAPRAVWSAPGEATIAAAGAAVTVTARGPDRLTTIREAATEIFADRDVSRGIPPGASPRFVGGAAFHADHDGASPWTAFPAAAFVLPRVQLARTDHGATLTVTAYGPDADPESVEATLEEAAAALAARADPPAAEPPGVTAVERDPSRAAWGDQVSAAVERIRGGDLRKVVLAQSLRATLEREVDPVATLDRLGERYPDCYRFLFAPTDAAAAVGATPERLVARRGRTVETEALAGSVGRADAPTEDEALAAALRRSDKEGHEHALVVDAIRDRLVPLAASVTTGDRAVRRLATVQHLRTPIRARLVADRHVLSLVESLHPTPAVGGLPPRAAEATIRETETFDRGWYAAPIGWFDARGDGEFAVAIRSAVLSDREATLFAGAGIVNDSTPDDEWDEVQVKYHPILDALSR